MVLSIDRLSFPGGTSGKEPACRCWGHETWVWSLGQEDPLEEKMATHSSILAWRIPWTERPRSLKTMGSHRVTQLNWFNKHAHTVYCLPMNWGSLCPKGVWWFGCRFNGGGHGGERIQALKGCLDLYLWSLAQSWKSHSEMKKYRYSTHSCHLVEKQIITQYKPELIQHVFLLRVVTCQGDVVQKVWGSFFFDLKECLLLRLIYFPEILS